MEPVLFGLAQRLASYLPAVFLGLGLPVGGWFAARIERLGSRRRVNPDAVTLRRNAARTVLAAVGLVTALGTLGVNVSALAGLGLTGSH